MNTGAEPSRELAKAGDAPPAKKPISEVLDGGADARTPMPVDESAAALEAQLQKETDGRQEDRFYSIAIGTVLINMAVFQHLPWIGILCIFLLEIIILIGLAKRLGSEHVTILLNFLFHKLCERIGLGKDDSSPR